MLSQARALTCEMTERAVDAAPLAQDEFKRHCPPYNVAPTDTLRQMWFATRPRRTQRAAIIRCRSARSRRQ
jgi:excinuclease UvrABC nuclease subunit